MEKILNYLKNALNYFGFFIKKDNTLPHGYNISDYINREAGRHNLHKELLQSLEKKEEDRLNLLETKTSQFITYTGIIFSALSLFIPILLDKISDHNLITRIVFIITLACAFLFYVLTIHNAIRNYNIGEFKYGRSDPNNVIKYQFNTTNEFTTVEIQDLLYSYNRNSKTNNDKANNLIYAYRSFRIANIFTALMGILICSSLLFTKSKDKEITIKNPIIIKNIDSTSKTVITNIQKPDTIFKTDTIIKKIYKKYPCPKKKHTIEIDSVKNQNNTIKCCCCQ